MLPKRTPVLFGANALVAQKKIGEGSFSSVWLVSYGNKECAHKVYPDPNAVKEKATGDNKDRKVGQFDHKAAQTFEIDTYRNVLGSMRLDGLVRFIAVVQNHPGSGYFDTSLLFEYCNNGTLEGLLQ